MSSEAYTIKFEGDFSLSHSDQTGVIKFPFDPGENFPDDITLYSTAFDLSGKNRIAKTPENMDRIATAFQRVVSYLKEKRPNRKITVWDGWDDEWPESENS
ncbi:hypothetical protein [Verrucomicrobium sp. BvORR106]|uniref:hypothetical protein n=1 Tax=Verrucomicrobium sp. BvORR106 TaxID=1403819 RepID=UPI00056F3B3C|nr:hypothetical protein [Verrucomicrobium sp. BvORR106]